MKIYFEKDKSKPTNILILYTNMMLQAATRDHSGDYACSGF